MTEEAAPAGPTVFWRFLKKYRYALPLAYLPLFLAWYFWLEQRPGGDEIIVGSPLDALIPFREEFILAYALWFPYMLGFIGWLYVTDRNRTEFPRLAYLLIAGLTVCMVGYTFWSTTTYGLRPDPYPRDNLFTDIVRQLQDFDTPTNVFPSMHVYGSIVVHHCIWVSEYLRGRPWVRYVSLVAMVFISVSTVFLKQHSIVDVVAAAVLFLLVWAVGRLIRSWAARRSGGLFGRGVQDAAAEESE